MKKILGVVGSARKNGNTNTLVSKILEGAQEAGLLTEMILLTDLDIKECDGCHTCWKGNDCSKQDDMNQIYSKISGSDIIIFGTPVYWYGPTALIKAFLDRFVYFNSPQNRIKLRGKSAIIVIPFEENDVDTAAPLITMFEKSFKYLNIPLIETVIVPGVTKKGEVAQKEDIMAHCFDLGKKL